MHTQSQRNKLLRWEAAVLISALVVGAVLVSRGQFGWGYGISCLIPLTAGLLHWSAKRRRDRRIRRWFGRRPDSNLDAEFAKIRELGVNSREEIERLWHGLAAYFRVPACKLRANDDLYGELLDRYEESECDLWTDWGLLDHEGPSKKAAELILKRAHVSIGELLVFVSNYERERGVALFPASTGGTNSTQRVQTFTCCRKCGYDLQGNTLGQCPECGSALGDP